MSGLIINSAYVKNNGEIHSNLDEGYIKPIIRMAQETVIKELLGSAMYDDLISEIEAESVSANYTSIQDYLANIMLWEVHARVVKQTTLKLTNQGAVTKSGDNNTALTAAEIGSLAQTYRNKADYYRGRLWKYLCENSSSYPLWYNPPSGTLVCPRKPKPRYGF